MEQLCELFTEIGFINVRSYINSGNIFFDTDNYDRPTLTRAIEQHLYKALGFEVPTFLRTPAELKLILSQEPFKGIQLTSDKRFCVVFTNTPLNTELCLPLPSPKNNMNLVAVNAYEAFVVWNIINGRPPSGKFAKDIIPASNTSRFYHTLNKILASNVDIRILS